MQLRGRRAHDLSGGRHRLRLGGRRHDLLGELVVVVQEVTGEVGPGRGEVLVEGVGLVGQQRHGAIAGRVDRALCDRIVGLRVRPKLGEVQPSGQPTGRK